MPVPCILSFVYLGSDIFRKKTPAPGLSLVTRLDCAGVPGGLEDAGMELFNEGSCWEPIL